MKWIFDNQFGIYECACCHWELPYQSKTFPKYCPSCHCEMIGAVGIIKKKEKQE